MLGVTKVEVGTGALQHQFFQHFGGWAEKGYGSVRDALVLWFSWFQ